MRTLHDKQAQLRRLVLSSAFSQAEANDLFKLNLALFRGICRRQEVKEGRREVPVADKIDSLSRRIEYRLDKLGVEV